MRKKRFVQPHICLCRKCEGSGTMSVYKEHDILRLEPAAATCDVCNGTGRVIISSETIITITPFSDDQVNETE